MFCFCVFCLHFILFCFNSPISCKSVYKGLWVVFKYSSHQLHLQHSLPTLVTTPSEHTTCGVDFSCLDSCLLWSFLPFLNTSPLFRGSLNILFSDVYDYGCIKIHFGAVNQIFQVTVYDNPIIYHMVSPCPLQTRGGTG